MKMIKGPSEVEIHEDGGVSTGALIMISFVCLLVGFIFGATVAILKIQPMVTPTPAPMVGHTGKEPEKNMTADHEREIRRPEAERK
jgi:hypothetical protein